MYQVKEKFNTYNTDIVAFQWYSVILDTHQVGDQQLQLLLRPFLENDGLIINFPKDTGELFAENFDLKPGN